MTFDGVRVSEANRLGEEGQGFSFAMKACTTMRVLLCVACDEYLFYACFLLQWMGVA